MHNNAKAEHHRIEHERAGTKVSRHCPSRAQEAARRVCLKQLGLQHRLPPRRERFRAFKRLSPLLAPFKLILNICWAGLAAVSASLVYVGHLIIRAITPAVPQENDITIEAPDSLVRGKTEPIKSKKKLKKPQKPAATAPKNNTPNSKSATPAKEKPPLQVETDRAVFKNHELIQPELDSVSQDTRSPFHLVESKRTIKLRRKQERETAAKEGERNTTARDLSCSAEDKTTTDGTTSSPHTELTEPDQEAPKSPSTAGFDDVRGRRKEKMMMVDAGIQTDPETVSG